MATKKKASKKASKKTSKKVTKKDGAKKKTKKSKVSAEDGSVTLKALADEAGISGQTARQKLRAADIEREDGSRWAWKEGSKALKAARKALDLA